MIEFHNVTKRFDGGFEALSNVSLQLAEGEMVFITGHSGAGKSTLLKIIALIEKPTRGQALLNRINLNSVARHRVPYIRRNIGIIFQDHQLLFDRPVFGNTLQLESGSIRFVPDQNGRGPGVTAIDISTSNTDAAIAAARERNLPVEANEIQICGTTIRLR